MCQCICYHLVNRWFGAKWWAMSLVPSRKEQRHPLLQCFNNYGKFHSFKTCGHLLQLLSPWILTYLTYLSSFHASLQAHHVYSTLKGRGNGRFQVVSTWNTRGVFVHSTLLWYWLTSLELPNKTSNQSYFLNVSSVFCFFEKMNGLAWRIQNPVKHLTWSSLKN